MTSSQTIEVEDADVDVYIPKDPPADYMKNVDKSATATLVLPNGIVGKLRVDLSAPPRYLVVPHLELDVKVEGDLGSAKLTFFTSPHLLHSITVKIRGGPTKVEKVYSDASRKSEEWRTTYMFQLENFVDKIKGREPKVWVSKEDSVATMECIEKIYAKVSSMNGCISVR